MPKIGFYPGKWTVFEIGHFGILRWRVCQFRQSRRVAMLTILAVLAFPPQIALVSFRRFLRQIEEWQHKR
jgi:hypothetical protein